jgi:hypothetical protein
MGEMAKCIGCILVEELENNVRFGVLTAVVIKNIFWDTRPCSPLKINVLEEYVASIFRAEI